MDDRADIADFDGIEYLPLALSPDKSMLTLDPADDDVRANVINLNAGAGKKKAFLSI